MNSIEAEEARREREDQWKRLAFAVAVLAVFMAPIIWLEENRPGAATQYSIAIGVLIGVLLGFALLSWTIFYVGRQIARVLWGLLIVAEKDDEQRRILEEQNRRIFR